MSLRHAVMAALLEGEASGYDLAKEFDASVANFWMATPKQLYRELDRHGVVATAILDAKELAEFRGHPEIAIEIRESVTGFNFSKGQTQTLHLALIRREALARRSGIAHADQK